MSKKVFLSPSNQYDNRYAYGNTTEGVQCGKIAEACKAALQRSGIEVMLMHDESMQEKCQKSDAFGADIHVPIHTNAANGNVSGTRTSVELIAQRVSNIETKVDDTNSKVDAQAKAWQETERKLSEKVNDAENKPYKQIANNVNTVKVAIITCISTLLVSGIIGAIIAFGK